MARHRKNNHGSLTYQVKQAIDSKMAIGESKHLAKQDGSYKDKIFSYATRESYIKQANYFTNWCKEKYNCKTLDQCHSHVNEFLKESASKNSSYTVKLQASAIAKVYGETTGSYDTTPARNRSEITRSRDTVVRDKHFSETRNKEIVDFAKSTGLRRSELRNIKGNALYFDDHGRPWLHVTQGTKGGRVRDVPIIGTLEVKNQIIQLMKEKGNDFVFGKVPGAMDVHGYRSDYATAYYKEIARDIKDIPFDRKNAGTGKWYQSDVYHCRGDQKGTKYDKVAMLEVSRALGHNRISVIGEHYLRGI